MLDARYFCEGFLYLCVRVKVNLNDPDAAHRLALHVLNAGDRRGYESLCDQDHSVLHILWRYACEGPDYADDRDINVRKDVRGHRQHG